MTLFGCDKVQPKGHEYDPCPGGTSVSKIRTNSVRNLGDWPLKAFRLKGKRENPV